MAMGRMNNFTSVLSRGDWDCQLSIRGIVAEIQYCTHAQSSEDSPKTFIFLKGEVQGFGVNVEKELERRLVSSERFCLFRVT